MNDGIKKLTRYEMTTEYNKYACEDVVRENASPDGEWVKYSDVLAIAERTSSAGSAVVMSDEQIEELSGEYANGDMGDFDAVGFARAILAAAPLYAAAQAPAPQPELTVWEGSMPESNGKSNFTAVLYRKNSKGFDMFTDGFTIARSEYPDRVRYEADCVRFLIGELAEKPWITDYDADKHSGYVPPAAPAQADSRDAARYRWLCEDHPDPEVRQKRKDLLDRMSVMAYGGISLCIDNYMKGIL